MRRAPLEIRFRSSSALAVRSDANIWFGALELADRRLRGIPVAGVRHRAHRGLRARTTPVTALGPVMLASGDPAHPLLNPHFQPGDHAALIHSPPASPRPTSSGYSP